MKFPKVRLPAWLAVAIHTATAAGAVITLYINVTHGRVGIGIVQLIGIVIYGITIRFSMRDRGAKVADNGGESDIPPETNPTQLLEWYVSDEGIELINRIVELCRMRYPPDRYGALLFYHDAIDASNDRLLCVGMWRDGYTVQRYEPPFELDKQSLVATFITGPGWEYAYYFTSLRAPGDDVSLPWDNTDKHDRLLVDGSILASVDDLTKLAEQLALAQVVEPPDGAPTDE